MGINHSSATHSRGLYPIIVSWPFFNYHIIWPSLYTDPATHAHCVCTDPTRNPSGFETGSSHSQPQIRLYGFKLGRPFRQPLRHIITHHKHWIFWIIDDHILLIHNIVTISLVIISISTIILIISLCLSVYLQRKFAGYRPINVGF